MTTTFKTMAFVAMGLLWTAQTSAQTPASSDPNPGNMTLTGSFDAVSTYMFRGIRQHSTGVALWPAADLGIALYSGDGGLKSVGINVGTWNSLQPATPAATARAASCGTSPISTPLRDLERARRRRVSGTWRYGEGVQWRRFVTGDWFHRLRVHVLKGRSSC